jgi:hypothetical protein
MMKHRSRWWLAIAGLVTLGLLITVYWHWHYRYGAGRIVGHLSNDIDTRMAQDMQRGNTYRAIEEGQRALEDDPKNTSLLQSLAIACLVQAQKEPGQQSEEWIRKSASYANGLAKNTSKQDLGAIVYIIQAGKSLEWAGNLSASKCVYYKQAIDVLENQGPVVNEGNTVTAYGRTLSLTPALKEKRKTLEEVRKKLTDAHCD